MLRRVHLPYSIIWHGGEAGDTGYAVHDLRDDMAFIAGGTITDGCSFQDAFQIHAIQLIAFLMISIAWACQQDLPAHMKIRCMLLDPCQSDFRGRRRWPAPTFPCMEWFIDCWHVPGWSWRTNYRSWGPCSRGGNLILWMMITQRGAPLGKCKGCWIQLDRPN